MKFSKVLRRTSLLVMTCVSLAFISCGPKPGEEEVPEQNDTSKTEYTLSVSEDTVSFDEGDDAKTITVTTNGTVEVEVEAESIATATISEKTLTITPVAAGTTTVTVTCKEDSTKTVDIVVTVNKITMTVNLVLSDAVAIPGGSIDVTYGSGADTTDDDSDDKYVTVPATVAADGKSATVTFEKKYSNSYLWFNGIKLEVKDSERSTVEVAINPNYCEFNADMSATITVSKVVAAKIFTINFDGFSIPKGTVTGIKISNVYNDFTNAVDATVTVSEDGSSATFEVPYTAVAANGDFYVNLGSLTIKASDGTAIVPNGGDISDKWFGYNESDNFSATLTLDTLEYTTLLEETEVKYAGSYYQVLDFSAFVGKEITTLKVTISEATDWVSLTSAEKWATATYIQNCKNTTTIIKKEDSPDFIAGLSTYGLAVESSNGAALKIKVEYN